MHVNVYVIVSYAVRLLLHRIYSIRSLASYAMKYLPNDSMELMRA